MKQKSELNKRKEKTSLKGFLKELKEAFSEANEETGAQETLSLSELFQGLRALALQGSAHQKLLFAIWGTLAISLPIDFLLFPVLAPLLAKLPVDTEILILSLFALGGISLVLSFHRKLLLFGHHLDRGLHSLQRNAGEHPWFIIGIFVVAILFELSVRLESFGFWPILAIFVLLIATVPLFARNWKSQLEHLAAENSRRLRILEGAQRRNFILILLGLLSARLFSIAGMALIAKEQGSLIAFFPFILGSLALLSAAIPFERMFVDRCRSCGRTFPLPLETHFLCLICTKQRKLPKTSDSVKLIKPGPGHG